MINSFHFLRPWWLLAIIPALILIYFFAKKSVHNKNNWAAHCDPHLLPFLVNKTRAQKSFWLPALLFGAWLTAIIALAGPTWELYAQPVYQKNIARVIALDVSQSMNSTDIAPSRLQRAKYKTLDILHQIKEGQTGMLVFSSSAFVVSPLTSDTNTIASMIPILDSGIVPVQGSDIGKALQKSGQLLSQAGYTQGQIILITDSIPDNLAINEAQKLSSQGYKISVLAVGSSQSAPITNASGVYAKDANGNIAFSKLDEDALEKLALTGKGEFAKFSGDDSDIKQLLEEVNQSRLNTKSSQDLQTKSLWKDEGHWLIWLLIILVACFARSGWLEKLC